MVKSVKRLFRLARNVDDYAIAKVVLAGIDRSLEAIFNGATEIELTIQIGVGIKLKLKGDATTVLRLCDVRDNLPTNAKELKDALLSLVDNNDPIIVFTTFGFRLGIAANVGIAGTYPAHTLYSGFDYITGRAKRNVHVDYGRN